VKTEIIEGLVQIGAVKFGSFTLKSGLVSPVYVDLRMIVAYPRLMGQIVGALGDLSQGIGYDLVAGIPYTALPIAALFAQKMDRPMIYARKEIKGYGTKKRIEGVYKKGQRVLVLDDLITNGLSKFETFKIFEDEGLRVKDVVVLIDRRQGGKETLAAQGYHLHAMIDLFEILDYCLKTGQIDQSLYQTSRQFIENSVSVVS